MSPSVHKSFTPGPYFGHFFIFNSVGFAASGDCLILGSISQWTPGSALQTFEESNELVSQIFFSVQETVDS